MIILINTGFPHGASGKELTSQYRRRKRHGFNPWSGLPFPSPMHESEK